MPRAGQTKLMPGDKFGELTLVRFLGSRPTGCSKWEAACSCGSRTVVRASNLSGRQDNRSTRSCGDRNKHPRPNTRHGLSRTREYKAWKSMLKRSRSKLPQVAIHYRDRGTTVCVEWQESFTAFLDYIGPMPEGRRIGVDRFPDQSGNYEPGNVRWADQKMQNSNRRPKRWETSPLKAA